MLKELYASGMTKDMDLNCAETVLYIANSAYELGLNERTMKLSSGFGGGMCTERTCGALTAGIMVLGYLFVKEKAHESDFIKDLVKKLFSDYDKKMGCIDCAGLKDKYRTEERKCKDVIETALEVLEEIINNNEDKKVV